MNVEARIWSIAAGAALAMMTSSSMAASAGQAAPDFSVADTHGNTVRLNDFRGKYVVLEWTNPECPFVRRHYNSENMPGLQKEWSSRGVVWLSIDSSNRASRDFKTAGELDRWMQSHRGAPTQVLLDSDSATAKLYGAKTTPHMFVIGPEGRIVYAGAIDDKPWASAEQTLKATNYVRAALVATAAGKAANPAN